MSPDFAAKLNERNPRWVVKRTASYSRAEFQRIMSAARHDVRRAAERIRGNRALLERWRSGDIDPFEGGDAWERGELLDFIDRHCAVPRTAGGALRAWVARLGTERQHMTALHLSSLEATAFVVLLVGLTGQNRGPIISAPAGHHRPDGYSGGTASAIVELDKPRRAARRHMDVPLVDMPDWIACPDGSDEDEQRRDVLRSAFGVYVLLGELAEPARRHLDSPRLLAWWAPQRSGHGLMTGIDSSHVRAWAKTRDLRADPPTGTPPEQSAKSPRLELTLARIRLTYNELHQKPVAHTVRTLANDYLARNRGNLAEYQRVVANVLDEQVAKARTLAAMRTLTSEDVAEARENPTAVAARHGMHAQTLKQLLAGELDTVMAGCIDNANSPHSPAGQPCRASFMLCLDCPCARAAPHHLPLQVLVFDELERRRQSMAPLRWAGRFALRHSQLADLLGRAGPAALEEARASATSDQRQLVARFLDRELDFS
ncbi:MAG: hypothetical protein J2P27_08045 [Actinobacteria bacterium]|nr:hypothetical protein [Actinomycetota bacterium]